MEKDPYGYVQSLREAEAKRKLLAEVLYTETEHSVNPWRTGSRSIQDEIIKRSPAELVKFYQREAADVVIPLFGKDRNLTVEGRFAKDDIDVLKRAQRIYAE